MPSSDQPRPPVPPSVDPWDSPDGRTHSFDDGCQPPHQRPESPYVTGLAPAPQPMIPLDDILDEFGYTREELRNHPAYAADPPDDLPTALMTDLERQLTEQLEQATRHWVMFVGETHRWQDRAEKAEAEVRRMAWLFDLPDKVEQRQLIEAYTADWAGLQAQLSQVTSERDQARAEGRRFAGQVAQQVESIRLMQELEHELRGDIRKLDGELSQALHQRDLALGVVQNIEAVVQAARQLLDCPQPVSAGVGFIARLHALRHALAALTDAPKS